jgi:hypothetical protein
MAALDGIVVLEDHACAAMRLERAGKPTGGCRSSHRLWARQSEVCLVRADGDGRTRTAEGVYVALTVPRAATTFSRGRERMRSAREVAAELCPC